VKCVFIDPPYNTGSAFEHYDDGFEHSLWLSLCATGWRSSGGSCRRTARSGSPSTTTRRTTSRCSATRFSDGRISWRMLFGKSGRLGRTARQSDRLTITFCSTRKFPALSGRTTEIHFRRAIRDLLTLMAMPKAIGDPFHSALKASAQRRCIRSGYLRVE
jgi:hypothetical protein